MTRASEFCYIGEKPNGDMLMALNGAGAALWTRNPELALRTTDKGKMQIANALGIPLGFRKLLIGSAG